MALHEQQTGGKYVSIIDGSLRVNCTKDTPNAVRREYEKKDGTKGVKYELVYKSLEGLVTGLSFKDADFGKVFEMAIDGVIVCVSTNGRYFTDLAKKLPNVDFSKDLYIQPYNFEVDGKQKTGVSLKQDDQKISNYFWDGKQSKNGIPEPTGEEEDGDDWKIYFTREKKFLIKFIEEMKKDFVATTEDFEFQPEKQETSVMQNDDDITDLPF